eukprot:CAMPEP_0174741628 /NCGR_PEP_ID=MMETSP1094-20130205/76827_1 /TAXON_ID=156173 /ORGANISM="Chrysochromulina brevifilum, Strain UTEX LB 985" /LENGTH=124 /DNA_ID=CAMNT_0015945537 /DNA_START=388 /DNA_END=763 /DNA_ORIENTATION=-
MAGRANRRVSGVLGRQEGSKLETVSGLLASEVGELRHALIGEADWAEPGAAWQGAARVETAELQLQVVPATLRGKGWTATQAELFTSRQPPFDAHGERGFVLKQWKARRSISAAKVGSDGPADL